MTLLSAIIQQGYRESNLIPIGVSPSVNELAEGLKRLQSLILSVLGMEAGEALQPLPIGNNNVSQPSAHVPDPPAYIPANVRLICNLTSAQTVYLHPRPQDGARLAVIDASGNFATRNLTLNGNGRLVDGAATDVLSTNGQSIQYFYRADLGDWKAISALASSDEMPFPEEFDDLFVIMLAMRLAGRNNAKLSQESVASMERSREQFRARYSQTVVTPADPGVIQYRGGNILDGWQ